MAAGSLKEAEAEVARAEAALNMAQQFLRDTLIKAPYSALSFPHISFLEVIPEQAIQSLQCLMMMILK